MYLFRTMIVPADHVALAREIAASFGPNGQNLWIVGYSPTGEAPATHYITSGYVPPEFAHLLTDPVATYEQATAQGVTTSQEAVDALFAAADISEEDVFVAMDRLGLKMIQEPME